MKTGFQRFSAVCVAAAAVLAGADAGAVRIDGIGLTLAGAATPAVRDGRLEVPLPGQQPLTIAPWPAYLPQRFGRQQIAAARQLHPAGPVDEVGFTLIGEPAPWLRIVRGARQSSPLPGDWQLQRSGRGWSVSNGSTAYRLGDAAQPVRIAADGRHWCIYLLESRVPAASHPGLAGETEAQADWAAVRLRQGGKYCQRYARRD